MTILSHSRPETERLRDPHSAVVRLYLLKVAGSSLEDNTSMRYFLSEACVRYLGHLERYHQWLKIVQSRQVVRVTVVSSYPGLRLVTFLTMSVRSHMLVGHISITILVTSFHSYPYQANVMLSLVSLAYHSHLILNVDYPAHSVHRFDFTFIWYHWCTVEKWMLQRL